MHGTAQAGRSQHSLAQHGTTLGPPQLQSPNQDNYVVYTVGSMSASGAHEQLWQQKVLLHIHVWAGLLENIAVNQVQAI